MRSPHHWLCSLLLAVSSAVALGQGRPQREGFVTAEDGIRLYYRIEGDGPQTVIVPAALYLHRDLQTLAKGRRMVFYDMRGRGRSDRVEDSTHITIQWDVRDMERVRQHVGAERFVPIGWSYLGFMVMLYASAHPDRVERIVQVGPVARRWDTTFPPDLTANDSVPVLDSAAQVELERLRQPGQSQGDQAAMCRRLYELQRAALVGARQLAERVPNPCEYPNEWPAAFGRHLRHHFVGSVQRLDVPWSEFERITVPVLTVHGTKDRNAPYGAGREWVSHLKEARLLTVQGAAHLPWIDQPTLVFDAIETFLRGDWPATTRRQATP